LAVPSATLAIFREGDGVTLLPMFQRRYATRDFSRFEDVIAHFRRQALEQGIDFASEPINRRRVWRSGRRG